MRLFTNPHAGETCDLQLEKMTIYLRQQTFLERVKEYDWLYLGEIVLFVLAVIWFYVEWIKCLLTP